MDNIEMEVITNNDNIDMNVISDDDNIQQDVTTETGTKNYNKLYNKPQINGVELTGNKSLDDLGIDQDFVKDDYYVHTDNNYTSQEKNKLSTLHNYDDTEIKAELNNKVDKETGKGLSTNDYTDAEKTKLASLENYDDTEVKSDITNLQTNKADKSEITNFITKDVNNLTYYTLKTDTGSLIDLEINSSTYVVTLTLKDQDGNSISTDSIDLPLETVVVGGRYDSASKKVILVLENGNEIEFSVADLVAGLQTEITSNNKLDSDLVDDTNSGNKFVTTSEKTTWNNKQNTINSSNKINSDFVSDVNQTNKFVTTTEKTTWNNKQNAINSSNKVASDLVDDTNQTNKFVTTTEKKLWNSKQGTWELIGTKNKGSSGTSTILDFSDIPINKSYKAFRICYYVNPSSSGIVEIFFNGSNSGKFWFGGNSSPKGKKFTEILIQEDYLPNIDGTNRNFYGTAQINRCNTYNYGQRTNFLATCGNYLSIRDVYSIKINIGANWTFDNTGGATVTLEGIPA